VKLGRKLTIGRRGYWVATAALMALQGFGPNGIALPLLAAWIMLYLARLRDAGRPALHLLHLAAVVILVFIPAFAAPDAFQAYLENASAAREPSTKSTVLFLVCMVGGLIYYFAFSIWLGCIKTRATPTPDVLADAFS
jgi:uncharacterized membrane protein YhaH (DUF805 family)